jgi:hypothetical protein
MDEKISAVLPDSKGIQLFSIFSPSRLGRVPGYGSRSRDPRTGNTASITRSTRGYSKQSAPGIAMDTLH